MGKKKKALLTYKRLGKLTKKLEKKFSGLIQANLHWLKPRTEESETIKETVEEEVAKVEEPIIESKPVEQEKPKPKTTRKTTPRKKATTKKATTTTKKPARTKKTTTTTRKRRTTKTKTAD